MPDLWGGFDLEELTLLMEEVVGQDPGALERDTAGMSEVAFFKPKRS